MPRQARLDAPGVLQHVMARGIERRKIFLDDKDRTAFLERFGVLLEETQTQCYAWALIPNPARLALLGRRAGLREHLRGPEHVFHLCASKPER